MNRILLRRSTSKNSAGLLALLSPVEWAKIQHTAVQVFTSLAWVVEYTERPASIELAAATICLYHDTVKIPYLLLAEFDQP